jgi:hypothetical protein
MKRHSGSRPGTTEEVNAPTCDVGAERHENTRTFLLFLNLAAGFDLGTSFDVDSEKVENYFISTNIEELVMPL